MQNSSSGRIVVSVLAFYAIVLAAYSVGYTTNHVIDVTSFVHAGVRQCLTFCDGLYIYPDSGYDGQMYYLMARHPLDYKMLKNIISVNQVAYRYQRIMYPLLVRFLSLGVASLIPYIMLAANLAFVALSAVVYQRLLAANGRPSILSLCAPLVIGLFVSVLLDLVEPMWFFLVLAGYYLLKAGRDRLSVIVFSVAFLTKETTFLILAPAVVYFLLKKETGRAALFASPFVVFLAWQLLIYSATGIFPFIDSVTHSANTLWIVESVGGTLGSGSPSMLPVYVILISCLLSIPVAAVAFRRDITPASTLFLANALFILPFMLKQIQWEDLFAASRSALPLVSTMLLYLAESGDRKTWYVLLPFVAMTFLLSGFYLIKALSTLALS